MPRRREGGLTQKEQAFCLYYFETRKPSLSCIQAGYPAKWASSHANFILRRPEVKAYLRKLWEKSESPIVMSVRERKEILSQIGRGMVGSCLDEDGEVDLKAVREMPAVKEITIEEYTVGVKKPILHRDIKVKLLNPVESIHELNLMEKLYSPNEAPVNINPIYNYYVTDGSVVEKLGRIGDRTQKVIELTGEKVEEDAVPETTG